jgi:Rps23 Pro-64 3,4-dihydroxylase Tpa1-like proline 4-hydroxylase
MDSFHKVPPHGRIRDWLGAEGVQRLLTYAQSNEHLFKDSEIVSGFNRSVRVSRVLDLGHFENDILAKIKETLPKIFEALCVKPFNPQVELDLAAHGDGAFFARHFDTIRHRQHRIISAIYYFHALPKAFSGGLLRLHSMAASGEDGTFVDIPPDLDSLVFFPSIFPHEVLRISSPSGRFLDSRFAINIWLSRAQGNNVY